jgi:hypothetical protein
MDIEFFNTLGKLISKFERFYLEGSSPEQFDPADLLDGEQAFFRIEGLANFWERDQRIEFSQYMTDLVISAQSQSQVDLSLVLLGTPNQLAIYISLGDAEATRSILEALFPGIVLEPANTRSIQNALETHCVTRGVVTGIPSQKSFDQNKQSNAPTMSRLERVVRGMHGTTWAYIVRAYPRPRDKVVEERMKVIDLLTQVTNRSRRQWSTSSQDNLQRTTSQSGGSSQSMSGETINYRAQYLIQLLQRELERMDQAMAGGQWIVRTYFGATGESEARRMAAMLMGAMAGADSRPEPLRAIFCQDGGSSLDHFHTFLTSQEVSTMIQLPREEVPGYALHDYVRFDVDFHTDDPAALPLGQIQQNGKPTSETFDISLDALAKHAVVIGVTGSGKTTTVMNLIDRVVHAHKPFLIIEPAKTEYRSLHSALPANTRLQIYTLGNETVAPFRLNPFEFEMDDEPGNASLLTHIDFLKAVFNAAFPLYAPMPQVLEEALHEVYEDKGWDLTNGINRRLTDWSERNIYPIFPTLTDLYYKVEEVTNRLGYHKEVESNVKAALKSRIGSLRIGSKGLMLDTPRGVPMGDLLALPTVLELESIGNDDEKTFLMGLFLARLYEYRRLQFANGTLPSGLQHLIVFEEAHRLLKNTSVDVAADSSNPRAQAIEVFTNMLSEVRAYGQGVLVAEQIPSKLAPDVLKNTNLKIVHRLIARDDRDSIGQTMNLSEDQCAHLGTLTPGLAAVYAEGSDHAYLVRLENYKRNLSPLPEARLREISRIHASVQPFQTILDIGEYGVQMAGTGGPDPATYQEAGKILDDPRSRDLWAMIILRLLAKPGNVMDSLTRFSEFIETVMPHLAAEQHDHALQMIIVKGCADFMHRRGAQYGWTYAQVEEIRANLTHGLLNFIRMHTIIDETDVKTQEELQELGREFNLLVEKASQYLLDFVEMYRALTQRRQGPYIGCQNCPKRCNFRMDVAALLTEQHLEWLRNELTKNPQRSEKERYGATARMATAITQSWLGDEPGSELDDDLKPIIYCGLVHTLVRGKFSDFEHAKLAGKLKPYFFFDTSEAENEPAAPGGVPAEV